MGTEHKTKAGLVRHSNPYVPRPRMSIRMGHKTYPLEVEDGLWEQYKDTVPRSQNLDDPILDFIENRVEEHNAGGPAGNQ